MTSAPCVYVPVGVPIACVCVFSSIHAVASSLRSSSSSSLRHCVSIPPNLGALGSHFIEHGSTFAFARKNRYEPITITIGSLLKPQMQMRISAFDSLPGAIPVSKVSATFSWSEASALSRRMTTHGMECSYADFGRQMRSVGRVDVSFAHIACCVSRGVQRASYGSGTQMNCFVLPMNE